jgi:hypothetical protein
MKNETSKTEQTCTLHSVITRSSKIKWWNTLTAEKCAELQNKFLGTNLKTRVDITLAKIHIMSNDIVKIYDSVNVL